MMPTHTEPPVDMAEKTARDLAANTSEAEALTRYVVEAMAFDASFLVPRDPTARGV